MRKSRIAGRLGSLGVIVALLSCTTAVFAQTVTFNLATASTLVANTGRAEGLGQLTLTADTICGTGADAACISTAGSLHVLYLGTPIDNTASTGIEVCQQLGGAAVPTCNTAASYVAGPPNVSNTGAGGVVFFGVNGGVNFAAGDQVILRGVRAQMDQSPGAVAGTSLSAQITASPSTLASFVPTSEVVARSADPLTVTLTGATLRQCFPSGRETITIAEGFNTAFVDHDVDPGETFTPGNTINDRPLFGATNNSRINVVLTGLPAGITVTWPATSTADETTAARLDLVSQSPNGSAATYVFTTLDQALSDSNAEVFRIHLDGPVAPLDGTAEISLSGTSADIGTATPQARMFPPPLPSGVLPRYNHPLEPLAPIPAALSMVSGSNQTGTVGQRLGTAFAVKVTDNNGNPISGINVSYAVTDGGGTLSESQVSTDLQGLAITTLTLGTQAGENTVTASSGSLAGSPVRFTATGVAGPPAMMSRVSGDGQTGTVGQVLADFVVQVADAFGNPAAGVPVSFAVTAGGGILSGTQVWTNLLGLAAVSLTLGPEPGNSTVTATSTRLAGSSLTFNATGLAGAVQTLSVVNGNNQTGTVGQALGRPFVVKATDAFGNAVAGAVTSFAVTAGGGTLSSTQVTTDANGLASSTLILGPSPGINTVTASSAGSSVIFTATATETIPVVALHPGAVVNGASFRLATEPGGAVAPGTIVAIFGENLANQTQEASSLPLPTAIGDTSVRFHGIAAPLFFVSKMQINAQVPFEVPIGTVLVEVRRGAQSATQGVQVAEFSPGIFPANPARAVRPGEFLVLYCTGLGLLSRSVASGAPPPIPPPQTLTPPLVTIGGIPAELTFAGAAPGFVGLYQVNVRIPPGISTGIAVPVVLTIGGIPSNTGTVAIE